MNLLDGITVVTLAINLPGPVAASRLRDFGAHVVKVEPPSGDPFSGMSDWYGELTAGMDIVTLDLKAAEGRAALDEYLARADLLLTSSRPASLARIGVEWSRMHAAFPQLCWVGIVGYPPPKENIAGHDLNYQAWHGTLDPPAMPKVLVADMAGAERAVQAALALLLGRERGHDAGHRLVALSEASEAFAETLRRGVTAPGGVLGGGLPNYRIYAAKEGFAAVGALEPHFYQRLLTALAEEGHADKELEDIMPIRTAEEWEAWADERDIPIAAVRNV